MPRQNQYRHMMLLLAFCLHAFMYGQTSLEQLAVHDVFSGRLADTRVLSETHVTGNELAKYHLTVFRSVQCCTTASGFQQMERLLAADEKKASEKEVQRANHRTQLAIFRYAQKNAKNHYIIFQRRSQTDFVCVYLEGTASIQQLKTTFSK